MRVRDRKQGGTEFMPILYCICGYLNSTKYVSQTNYALCCRILKILRPQINPLFLLQLFMWKIMSNNKIIIIIMMMMKNWCENNKQLIITAEQDNYETKFLIFYIITKLPAEYLRWTWSKWNDRSNDKDNTSTSE